MAVIFEMHHELAAIYASARVDLLDREVGAIAAPEPYIGRRTGDRPEGANLDRGTGDTLLGTRDAAQRQQRGERDRPKSLPSHGFLHKHCR